MLSSFLANRHALRSRNLPDILAQCGAECFDELIDARTNLRMIPNKTVQYTTSEIDLTEGAIRDLKAQAIERIGSTLTGTQLHMLGMFGLTGKQQRKLANGELPSCLKAYVHHRLEWGGDSQQLRVSVMPSYATAALKERAAHTIEGILGEPLEKISERDLYWLEQGVAPTPVTVLVPAPRPLELNKYDAGLRIIHSAMEEAKAGPRRVRPVPRPGTAAPGTVRRRPPAVG